MSNITQNYLEFIGSYKITFKASEKKENHLQLIVYEINMFSNKHLQI